MIGIVAYAGTLLCEMHLMTTNISGLVLKEAKRATVVVQCARRATINPAVKELPYDGKNLQHKRTWSSV
jgi:hypothetical protein